MAADGQVSAKALLFAVVTALVVGVLGSLALRPPGGAGSSGDSGEGIADKDTSFEKIQANLRQDLKIFHTGSLAITPSQLPKVRRLFELIHL